MVRRFKARRVCCGGDGDNVTLDAYDTGSFHCAACDADFDAGTVRKVMAAWQALLAWTMTAPPLPEGG